MKKSSLTTSVVAGIAGVAGLVNVSSALNVNPDGLGQVLIYPYYTTNGGNTTAISIVNTTDDVKAVKVRFLEGRNSQEVLDFNLYLSAFDVWTGAVVDKGDADGPAYLITADTSCTAPPIPAAGEPFKSFEYAANNPDGGPYHIQRTREGHVEMIEMGRVVNDGDVSEVAPGPSVSAVDRNAPNPAPFAGARLATAATHLPTGVPANCGAIHSAWGPSGQWTTNRNLDIDTPNGGLFGGAQIIDTSNGTNLSYNADAIEGFYISETFQNLHFSPGTVDPKLADAQSSDGGEATAIIFNNGTLYQFTFTTPGLAGRNAVSAVFMHNEIYNEYNTNAFTASESEWVVTFPTKRLHTEEPLLINKLPFRSTYLGDEAPYDDLIGACEPIDVAFYDREEQVPGNIPPDLIFSPPPPSQEAPGLNLCFEAQVITINQPTAGEVLVGNDPSAILGSYFPRNINLCQIYNADGSCQDDGVFTLGWMRMTLGSPAENFMFTDAVSVDPANPNIIVGLPATGFWAANYINADAEPGMLANYSGLHKHRADRETVAGEVFEDLTYTIFEGSGE